MAETLRIDFFTRYLIEIRKADRKVWLLREVNGEIRRISMEPGCEVLFGSASRSARFQFFKGQPDGNLGWTIGCKVVQDRWSSTPVFVFQTSEVIFLSNRDFLIFQALADQDFEFKFNSKAVLYFLRNGYVPLGESFVEGLVVVLGSAELFIGQSTNVTRPGPFNSIPTHASMLKKRSPDDWLHVLKSALESDVEDCKLNVFRMSGGVDTRTLSLLLGKKELEKVNFEITAHPGLPEDLDADLIAAKKLCTALRVRLRIHSDHEIGYRFFHKRNQERILSGLYGGEFFGGTALLEWPQKCHSTSGLIDGNDLDFKEYESQHLVEELATPHVLAVFLKTYHSHIYGKVSPNWQVPWMNSEHSVSPFTHPDFLDLVNETGLSELQNYRVYVAAFSRLLERVTEDLRAVPLSSQITSFDSALPNVMIASPKYKNPKDLVHGRLELEPARRQRFIKGLKKIGIQTEGVDWENTGLFDRLISVGQWMKRNGQTLFREIV